jgi:hypothetical protein
LLGAKLAVEPHIETTALVTLVSHQGLDAQAS